MLGGHMAPILRPLQRVLEIHTSNRWCSTNIFTILLGFSKFFSGRPFLLYACREFPFSTLTNQNMILLKDLLQGKHLILSSVEMIAIIWRCEFTVFVVFLVRKLALLLNANITLDYYPSVFWSESVPDILSTHGSPTQKKHLKFFTFFLLVDVRVFSNPVESWQLSCGVVICLVSAPHFVVFRQFGNIQYAVQARFSRAQCQLSIPIFLYMHNFDKPVVFSSLQSWGIIF